jgi:hypothetical protein
MALKTYQEVITYLSEKKRQKHLLLGNGFSMAYDHTIFSYNALYQFIDQLDNDVLSKLFGIINTKNFELVMQQLDNFIELAKEFSTDKQLISNLEVANSDLKNSLIEAVKELHPEHVFTIPEEKSESCANFLFDYLNNGGNIFSTNYDLLLYWVLMRNKAKNPIDGFGRDLENFTGDFIPEEEKEYSELRWGKYKKHQNVHYVHGTLPIFDTGIDVIKVEYDNENYLLENIKNRLDNKEYPIFVTAGNGNEKLNHIMHNKYLTNCYERLSTITGSLVTFGFNFGEYDKHIIEALNKATKYRKEDGGKLLSIYIGVYSDDDRKYILSIKDKFNCKVNIYDAKTANVWGS